MKSESQQLPLITIPGDVINEERPTAKLGKTPDLSERLRGQQVELLLSEWNDCISSAAAEADFARST